jgi:hypothetical protein
MRSHSFAPNPHPRSTDQVLGLPSVGHGCSNQSLAKPAQAVYLQGTLKRLYGRDTSSVPVNWVLRFPFETDTRMGAVPNRIHWWSAKLVNARNPQDINSSVYR